jgi:hypothetical protein
MDINNNKEIISRLKFIGKIQIGEKISLKDMNLQQDGLVTQIYRTINQDNRFKTLVFIQDTITKTFEIIKCYDKSKKNSDKVMCMNLINDLKKSRNGILNLKETYNTDVKFICDIDTLLEIIEAKLSEIDMLNFSPLIMPSTSPPLAPPPFPKNFLSEDEDRNSVQGDNL